MGHEVEYVLFEIRSRAANGVQLVLTDHLGEGEAESVELYILALGASNAAAISDEYDHTLLELRDQDGHQVFVIESVPHEGSAVT